MHICMLMSKGHARKDIADDLLDSSAYGKSMQQAGWMVVAWETTMITYGAVTVDG